jgi:hypothetical protein
MDVQLARNVGTVAGWLAQKLPDCQIMTETGWKEHTQFVIDWPDGHRSRFQTSNATLRRSVSYAFIDKLVKAAPRLYVREDGVLVPYPVHTQG